MHIYVYLSIDICRYMYTGDYTGNYKTIEFHAAK